MTAIERYRVAVIGCGAVASHYDRSIPTQRPLSHAGAYHVHPRTEIVAAVDPDVEQRAKFGEKWGVSRLYASVDELLAAEDALDIVSICSPTNEHVAHLRASRARGVPVVLLEKPVCGDVVGARELAAMTLDAEGIAVNYYRRWSPYFERFSEELREGAHGTPTWCRFVYMKGLVHNGTHFLDLAEWLFGPATEVQALRWSSDIGEDGSVDALLRFKGGLACYLLAATGVEAHAINVMEMDLMTDCARIRFEKGGRTFQFFSPAEDSFYPGRTYFEPSGEPVRSGSEATFLHVVDNLVGYLAGEQELRCGLREGLRALRLAQSILESARSGGSLIRLN